MLDNLIKGATISMLKCFFSQDLTTNQDTSYETNHSDPKSKRITSSNNMFVQVFRALNSFITSVHTLIHGCKVVHIICTITSMFNLKTSFLISLSPNIKYHWQPLPRKAPLKMNKDKYMHTCTLFVSPNTACYITNTTRYFQSIDSQLPSLTSTLTYFKHQVSFTQTICNQLTKFKGGGGGDGDPCRSAKNN